MARTSSHTPDGKQGLNNDRSISGEMVKQDLARRSMSDSGLDTLRRRPMSLELRPGQDPTTFRSHGQSDHGLRAPAGSRKSSHIPSLPIEAIESRDFSQVARKAHRGRVGQPLSASFFGSDENASRTATIDDSWPSDRVQSGSDATERYNSPARSDSSQNGLASVSSRYSDRLAEDVALDEIARSFSPQRMFDGHFSPNQARHRAVKKIQTWLSSRANSPELSLNQVMSTGRPAPPGTNRPPTDASSDASLSADEVEQLWRKLLSKRQQVKRIRRSMAKTRSRLKDARAKLYNADNTFMSAVRPIILGNKSAVSGSTASLEGLFIGLQDLRTNVQDLELQYDEAERQLWKRLSQMFSIEDQFYDLLGLIGDEDAQESVAASSEAPFQTDLPLDLKGISSERSSDPHPLYARLENAVAMYRSWQEEYTDLWEAKEHAEEQIARSERLQLPIAEKQQLEPQSLKDPELIFSHEDLEFLDDFPGNQARIYKQLLDSQEEVSRLWKLCQKKGIVPSHPHVDILSAVLPEAPPVQDIDLGDKNTILSEHTKLAHPLFSELLSQPNYLLEHEGLLTPQQALEEKKMSHDDPRTKTAIREVEKERDIYQLLTDRDLVTTATFVDNWLLFNLRTSPLDAALLFTIFLKRLHVRNVVRWQRDVLKFWNQDGIAPVMDRRQAYNEQSQYFSRLATPQRSRAASDTPGKPSRHHLRASSIGSAVVRGSTPLEAP